MRRLVLLLLLAPLAACDSREAPLPDGPVDLAQPWTTATPEEVGMDSPALADADRQMDEIARARSLLVVREGQIVLERAYGGTSRNALHDVRSVTKSVIGLLTGIAVEDGDLAPTTTLGDGLGGAVRTLPTDQAAITVDHLLTMSGGWRWHETGGPDYGAWISSFDHLQFLLDRPLDHTPGTQFRYNSAAVHALGIVIEERTGDALPTYAERELFRRIGIDRALWERSTGGRVNGGSGLDLSARDLARIGQLVLQEGRSGDEQIVPREWVRSLANPAWDWRADYGAIESYTYGRLWWALELPEPAALAWGYGGQFVLVVPARDLVAVATTDWRGVSAEPGGPNAVERDVLEVLLAGVVPAAR